MAKIIPHKSKQIGITALGLRYWITQNQMQFSSNKGNNRKHTKGRRKQLVWCKFDDKGNRLAIGNPRVITH